MLLFKNCGFFLLYERLRLVDGPNQPATIFTDFIVMMPSANALIAHLVRHLPFTNKDIVAQMRRDLSESLWVGVIIYYKRKKGSN